MIKYVVSSCLAGIKCRYDGKCKKNDYVTSLVEKGLAYPMCPEVLGGLKIPRDPAEINGDKVITKNGVDVTENYYNGACRVLEYCKKHNIKKAILMDKSPSCGLRTYDGTFSETLIDKKGITSKMLIENGIEVVSSDSLKG